MPESKKTEPDAAKVAAAAKAEAAAEDTKITGKSKVPSADEGLVPASETAGAKTEGGTVRLRDPEPVADADPADADDLAGTPLDPGPDETLTNEPIEDHTGSLRNPKPEALGAVGELDPKGRCPEEFKAAQRKKEAQFVKRLNKRRAERREAANAEGEVETEAA